MICQYCNNKAELVDGAVIYPHRQDLYIKNFWLCRRCDAYVGCHDKGKGGSTDGTKPLGILANKALRKAKSKAHLHFDEIWKHKHMSREDAYSYLASTLGIPVSECHIGMFDEDLCEAVSNIAIEFFNKIGTRVSNK